MIVINKLKDSKSSCIYVLRNSDSNKIYIGSTRNFNKRIKEHKNNLCNNTHSNIMLQRCYNKNIILEADIIEECTIDNLIEREIFYINKYNSKNRNCGYNICDPIKKSYQKLSIEEKNSINTRNNPDKKKGIKRKQEHIDAARKGLFKKVDVYDINLKFLYTTESMIDAENKTGVLKANISHACRKRKNCLKGYIFRYNGEKPEISRTKLRKIIIDKKEFDTVEKASNYLNISKPTMTKYMRLGYYKDYKINLINKI